MPFKVDGQVEIGISLGEGNQAFDLPIYPSNLIELSFIQNTHLLLPSFVLKFYDEAHIQELTGALGDGSTLSMYISDSKFSTPKYSSWNLYGKPKVNAADQQGTLYTLIGYLNVPDFFRKRVRKSYEGSSLDVISEIANEVGLKIKSALSPDDSQVWLPNGKSLGEFCRTVSERGWKDDKSCLMMGVTEKDGAWELRYVDIVEQFKSTPKCVFINGQPNTLTNNAQAIQEAFEGSKTIVVLDHSIRTESGLNNMMFGYGRRTGYQKIDGSFEQYEQIVATRSSKFIDINKLIKTALKGSVVREYTPIDSGNTHSNYHRAYHQNRMMQSTYSNALTVLIGAYSGLSLFDVVRVKFITPAGKNDPSRSGLYIVKAKQQTAAGTYYREKIELVSQGPDIDVGGYFF